MTPGTPGTAGPGLRFVFVVPHFGPVPGGIQKDMLCLARELAGGGDRVSIITTFDEFPEGRVDLGQAPAYALPAGVTVTRVRGALRSRVRNFQPANPPLWLPALPRAIRAARPDAAVFFNIGWPLTVLPALLAARRQTTVLYRTAYHAYGRRFRLDPWRQRLQLQVAGLSHRLLTYSDFEKRQVVADGGIPAARITPVYPGVEAHDVAPGQVAAFRAAWDLEGKIVIGHVARLSAFKGTGRLLQALPQVRERTGRDVVLLLAGRNVEPGYLAGLARELGSAAHVRWTGPLSDGELQTAYASSDIFALPSDYESFGLVFLEAMAQGVPALGPNTGGVPEVICDGETGYVLPAPDDLAGLVDRLSNLALDEELRRRLGRQAQAWARGRFNWAASAAALGAAMEQAARENLGADRHLSAA